VWDKLKRIGKQVVRKWKALSHERKEEGRERGLCKHGTGEIRAARGEEKNPSARSVPSSEVGGEMGGCYTRGKESVQKGAFERGRSKKTESAVKKKTGGCCGETRIKKKGSRRKEKGPRRQSDNSGGSRILLGRQ